MERFQVSHLRKWRVSVVTLIILLMTIHISNADSPHFQAGSSCHGNPAPVGPDSNDGFGIMSVAFSADGKFILAGGAGDVAFLWNAQTGALLHCFMGHTFAVEYVAFAPDGKTVLTSAWDATSRLWDANTGVQLQIMPNDDLTNSPAGAVYSPDGKVVFTDSGEFDGILWDAHTGLKLHRVGNQENPVDGLKFGFSPDGKFLLTMDGNKDRAMLWDVQSGALLHTLQGDFPYTWMFSMAFSPDGKTVLTGDQEVVMWDMQTGTRLQTWQVFKTVPRTVNYVALGVLSIEYLPDGKTVITDGDEGPIVWDAQSGKQLRVLKDAKHYGLLSPDGQTLAVNQIDSATITLWDVKTGTLLRTLTLQPSHPSNDIGNPYIIQSIAFSPDSKRLLTGSEDDITREWDVQSGKLLLSLNSPVPGFPAT